jgi:hypothetical protein
MVNQLTNKRTNTHYIDDDDDDDDNDNNNNNNNNSTHLLDCLPTAKLI